MDTSVFDRARQMRLDAGFSYAFGMRGSGMQRVVAFLSLAARTAPKVMTSTAQDPKTWRPTGKIGPSRYMPHQGPRECARRRRQMGLPE